MMKIAASSESWARYGSFLSESFAGKADTICKAYYEVTHCPHE